MTTEELRALMADVTPDWELLDDNCIYSGKQLIAIVTDDDHNNYGQYFGDVDQGPVNARLIAAAPDLAAEVLRLRAKELEGDDNIWFGYDFAQSKEAPIQHIRVSGSHEGHVIFVPETKLKAAEARIAELEAELSSTEKLVEAVRKECRTFNGVSPDLARALAAWEAAK